MHRRCRDPVAVAGAPHGHAEARGQARPPGGKWEPVASQAARSAASMGAVYAACVKKMRACVKKPGRAVGSRLERIARTAEVAGQQRVGLAG
eukprot:8971582-Alexandrium_andersonii.AAC.1